MLLNVLGCWLTYLGQAETNAEAWFNVALCPQKPEGSLGRTAQDGHLNLHTAPATGGLGGGGGFIYRTQTFWLKLKH